MVPSSSSLRSSSRNGVYEEGMLHLAWSRSHADNQLRMRDKLFSRRVSGGNRLAVLMCIKEGSSSVVVISDACCKQPKTRWEETRTGDCEDFDIVNSSL